VVEVPAHRGGEVAGLGLQARRALALTAGPQRTVGPLGEHVVVVGVAPLHVRDVRPRREPLCDQLADRAQHPRPRAQAVDVDGDEAVAPERLGRVERPVLVHAGDDGRRLDGPAVGEHGRGLQQRPLGLVEQADAPLDGRTQGPLALG
jgi:hypothetical protein